MHFGELWSTGICFACDMSFKKTAITLIVVTAITAVVAGVYLWFNFNSRSNLILVVPKNVRWFYHFQTSQIRKNTTGSKPQFLDSLTWAISKLPVFKNVTEPGQTGIRLHSDLVLFENKYGTYLALSLSSESKFSSFLNSLPSDVFKGTISTIAGCNFVKIRNHNLVAAYKHKALILFHPRDTTDKLADIEAGLSAVFNSTEETNITSTRAIQKLYAEDCDVICYHKLKGRIPAHGVVLKNQRAKFISAKSGRDLTASNALRIFERAGLTDVKYNKTISSNQYLNLTFKAAFYQLKPYLQ